LLSTWKLAPTAINEKEIFSANVELLTAKQINEKYDVSLTL